MQIGWIDFSKEDRNRALDVIHSLSESGTIDELGIGAIRDRFADYFFPGTSTVQTRAKYFLIVPYLLKEAGEGKYGDEVNAILRKVDKEEELCRDRLYKDGVTGVIGRSHVADSTWVQRAPSNIYWNGIKRLKIFRESRLSIREYIRQSISQRLAKQTKFFGNNADKKERKVKNLNEDNFDERFEKDDADAGSIKYQKFWNLNDVYNKDWKDGLSIELLPNEAKYLRHMIETNLEDSLFAYILKQNINIKEIKDFSELAIKLSNEANPELACRLKLAYDFNNLVELITTRYNIIVSQDSNEKAQKKWIEFSCKLKQMSNVDLDAIYEKLAIKRNDHTNELYSFLKDVKDAFWANDIESVDQLIIKREKAIKKPDTRAKTSHPSKNYGNDWVGIESLEYRYTPARRIILDIVNAEANKNV